MEDEAILLWGCYDGPRLLRSTAYLMATLPGYARCRTVLPSLGSLFDTYW
jgi:hypothetical protein